MDKATALARMVPPKQRRHGKPMGGVIQIHITRACDKACFNCTQGSNYRGKTSFISLKNFETAVRSLQHYFGIVGIFGGNPALHPEFPVLCEILRGTIHKRRLGLWCNRPFKHAAVMKETFNPAVSNLNVHLDQVAYMEFKEGWPECNPFGRVDDSRHSPVYVSPKDLNVPEGLRWELISGCDINQNWSAMVGEFRGELRGWFCEIAGAQSILHQDDPDYPDTGISVVEDESGRQWWDHSMNSYTNQVEKHCHSCGVPLRGYGKLSQEREGAEQTTAEYVEICRPKVPRRDVDLVTEIEDLRPQSLDKMTHYLQNAKR